MPPRTLREPTHPSRRVDSSLRAIDRGLLAPEWRPARGLHTSAVANTDTLLAHAADLERRDAEVASALEEVAKLSQRAGEIRASSQRAAEVFESSPGELAELDRLEAEAADASAEAVRVLDAAEQRVRELDGRRSSADDRDAAEHERDGARELAADAASRCERLAHEREELSESLVNTRAEAAELLREARRVADELQAVPRVSQSGREAPGNALAQLDEWASRVRAALFVVRGQLEAERDRLVREANELGSSALGEQLAGSSVSLVRRRLEEALEG